MKKIILLITALLMVVSCGSDSKKSGGNKADDDFSLDNDVVSESDTVSDNDLPDLDVVAADEDLDENFDNDNPVPDELPEESSDIDGDESSFDWSKELPEMLVSPEADFVLRVGGIISSAPALEFIDSTYNAVSGKKVLNNKSKSFFTIYQATKDDKVYDVFNLYLYEVTVAGMKEVYSAIVSGLKDDLIAAKEKGLHEIDPNRLVTVIYKADYSTGKSMAVCPVGVGDNFETSFFVWYDDYTTWADGENAGFAMNSSVKTDLPTILSMYNATKYYETCQCADIIEGAGIERDCTPDDANTPPNLPSSPQPFDGEENALVDSTLSWSCSDPEDQPLSYDVYIGENPDSLQRVMVKSKVALYKPAEPFKANTKYYWKVVAFDTKALSSESKIWSFSTNTVGKK